MLLVLTRAPRHNFTSQHVSSTVERRAPLAEDVEDALPPRVARRAGEGDNAFPLRDVDALPTNSAPETKVKT